MWFTTTQLKELGFTRTKLRKLFREGLAEMKKGELENGQIICQWSLEVVD